MTIFAKLQTDAQITLELRTNKLDGAQLAKLSLVAIKAISMSALAKVEQTKPVPNSPAKDIEHAFIAMRDLSSKCVDLIPLVKGEKGDGDA